MRYISRINAIEINAGLMFFDIGIGDLTKKRDQSIGFESLRV